MPRAVARYRVPVPVDGRALPDVAILVETDRPPVRALRVEEVACRHLVLVRVRRPVLLVPGREPIRHEVLLPRRSQRRAYHPAQVVDHRRDVVPDVHVDLARRVHYPHRVRVAPGVRVRQPLRVRKGPLLAPVRLVDLAVPVVVERVRPRPRRVAYLGAATRRPAPRVPVRPGGQLRVHVVRKLEALPRQDPQPRYHVLDPRARHELRPNGLGVVPRRPRLEPHHRREGEPHHRDHAQHADARDEHEPAPRRACRACRVRSPTPPARSRRASVCGHAAPACTHAAPCLPAGLR